MKPRLAFLIVALLSWPLSATEVTGLNLINADSNAVIAPLSDGDTLNLATLPTRNLSVQALVSGTVGSVRFAYDGNTNYQTESVAPYAIAGDSSGDYNAWTPAVGAHTLTATPYTQSGAGGTAGTALAIGFTVIDDPGAGGDPQVTLTSPANGATAAPPADFTLSADASDDGSIVQVEFFAGADSLGVDASVPYSFAWSGVPEGAYSLTAVATDDEGNTATSPAVTVYVVEPGSGGLVTGELKKWHKVSVTFDGPASSETATPNPFLDYRLDVVFTGPHGRSFRVPGYYAADGNAANTGATAGTKWRAHLAPDATGEWTYTATFVTGGNVAVDDTVAGTPTAFHGASGSFTIAESDKTGRDFRGRGRLRYIGGHYLRFADSGEYFLKQGPDAPENLLAYAEFDGPFKTDGHKDDLVKTWSAHDGDWTPGDPSWSQVDGVAGTHGQELVGALNYLASEGLNAFSFLTLNINGDDRNVFPYLNYGERTRMDVSRLDQWEILFEHADRLGLFLHVKTQETENETLLDGGNLGTQRKLYYRELIARFSHHLALNWNLGEENSDQTDAQRRDMAQYFWDNDPYRHLVVLHTYPGAKNSIYTPLLGDQSTLTGVSLQTNNANFSNVHGDVKTWVANSAAAGKPWAVAVDEPGDAQHALRPDNDAGTSHVDARKNALWGTFLGGGWGNEWYFGYAHAHSDLTCQDFRSRDAFWDVCRHALAFFDRCGLPYWEMVNDNAKSSASDDYCFFKENEAYIVYLKNGGTTTLDLSAATGDFHVRWYDPRNGGGLQTGTVASVAGGGSVSLGAAPSAGTEDWVILVSKPQRVAYIHGDVAADGDVPSGSDPAYHQMLLDDTGSLGMSIFKAMVEAEGYAIDQHYDQATTLDAAFLAPYDVIVFGLHQKLWSEAEKAALDAWLRDGGGMLIYSDSASGGHYATVGAQNPVGQTVVNNLISPYGMEVTVDQANGIKAYRAGPDASHPIVAGRPVLEGEGVSPVAVDPEGGAIRLIPYENHADYKVLGDPVINHQQNLTIQNPDFAALALAPVGRGEVIALFDRQPLWNNGPGSDIEMRDNLEILRRIVNHLAGLRCAAGQREVGFLEFLRDYPALAGADADPDADPDGDGLPNLAEQWFGLDPTTGDAAPLALTRDPGGDLRVSFSFNPATADGNLLYRISDDLVDWTTLPLPPAWITDQNGRRHVVALHPTPADRGFFGVWIEE